MSRKKRNTSSRAAKVRRQAQARAARQQNHVSTDWDSTLAAFTQAMATGSLRMMCDDGEARDVTITQIREHINAGLAADGEEPVTTEEFAAFLEEDLRIGALRLRSDGLWDSVVDYSASSTAAS
ncbi:hypothetical protein ACFYXD_35555 [Streptomyces platensis]|uniref:hypothetical protein n=1 Tax=Streptomyces platensis TaxID=58346 RepID=UPI00367725C0